jgi:hypothetical protein
MKLIYLEAALIHLLNNQGEKAAQDLLNKGHFKGISTGIRYLVIYDA